MEECPHGMEDPDWCSICKHGITRPEPVVVEYRFIAHYPGQCECNLPISIGQLAARLSNGAYVHEWCAMSVADA